MNPAFRRLLLGLALVVPGLAGAQILDFDGACGAPPCALAGQFAGSGVTFSPTAPTTATIVAAGTDGLTGTSGGSYVRVSTQPAQMVIQLNRRATFVSLNAARATSASQAVMLSVSMFAAGVQVGTTQTLVLGTVNTWASLAFSHPGGFDSVLLATAGGANTTFGLDNVQFGGRCNGFADVATTDAFCNATEWLANRGVTTGCAAGQYCPGGVVTRAQMALFLQRLGNAIAPAMYNVEQPAPSGWMSSPANGTDMCIVGPIRVTSAKLALLSGRVSATTGGAAQVTVRPSISVDGGPFNSITNHLDIGGVTAASNLSVNTTSQPTLLLPGRSYRFSVFPYRTAGSGSFTGAFCKLNLQVLDTAATAAPYDTAGDPPQSP